jgi:hypothetical protein
MIIHAYIDIAAGMNRYSTYGGLNLVGSSVYSVKVYKVTYSPGLIGASTPGASRSLSLTGLMMVPNRKSSALPVAAFMHTTTTVSSAVPSGAFDSCTSTSGMAAAASNSNPYTYFNATTNLVGVAGFCIPSSNNGPAAVFGALAAASMGYVAIAPDGIGYGGSSSAPRSYLIADDYAISTFNFLAAAITLVPSLQAGATVGKKMVVAGYSEGGYASLAVHRASLETRWAQAGVTVVASYPMAGPYDLATTEFTRALTQPQTVSRPSYVLLLAYSYWVALGMSTIIDSRCAAAATAIDSITRVTPPPPHIHTPLSHPLTFTQSAHPPHSFTRSARCPLIHSPACRPSCTQSRNNSNTNVPTSLAHSLTRPTTTILAHTHTQTHSYVNTMRSWYDGTVGAYTIDGAVKSATGNNFLNVFNATMVAEVQAGRPTDFTDALRANTLVSGWQPASGR